MKLRRGRGTTVLLEVFARCLNIACKDLGHVLVQMRAHDDAQAVDLLGVGRHRISRKDPSSFATGEELPDASKPESETGKSTALPDNPEDWPRVFERHLNAGDLDAVIALYEPQARFVSRSGEILVGHDQIRKVLGGMIAAKTRLHSQVIKAVIVGEIAQLSTDFEGTTVDDSGKTVPIHKAIDVLRRQRGGAWKLIVGNPNGRE